MKRVLAFLLCVMTLVTALPLTSFAAYENTHTNTGNQIEDLISVATTQIGYTEGNTSSQTGGTSGGSGNYTKYGKWYGINPGAWCAMFVSWCANQAGISSSIVPKHASCDIGMQWFQNNGKWKWSKALGGSYTPKRGDIIYFRTNTSITYDSTHVGIVYAADSSTVYTIEGNTSNKCARKSYSTSSAYILGYGTPAYTGGNTTPVTKTYTITMDPNGGSMVSNKTYQANYGETYTKIFGSFPMATRSGYVLTGWLCEKYSFTLTDSNMGNYYAVYENTTFKAVWEKGSTDDTPVAEGFTITFDPNGGSLTSGNKTYSINTGDYYKDVIKTMPTATRSGYTFTGWYCEKYGYTLSLGASEYFAVAENVTFKAQWEANAVATYSLSFNANGGSLSSGSSSYSITSGQTYKAALGSSMPTATRSGYTFNGWYCSAIGLTLTTSNWSNTFTANTNLTFVAQWTQNAATKYTMTYDPNGGTITSGNNTYQIENGQTYSSAIGTLPTATRSGYTFNGWYCEKYNFTLNSSNMGNYYAVTENTTFKAQWVSNNAVTLTLNAGPCGNGATKSISLTSKTLYHDKSSIYSNYGLLPSGGSSDQRVFMGWYTGYDAKTGRGTGTMYWDTYSGSGNETLYAIWGYPIVFNADGGTYKDGSQRYISYVANYAPWNGASDATDPMSRYIYMIPDLFDNAPVKGSLEREMAPSYALVTSGGDIYTMEGPDQNLTVPPTGGAMPWSAFRCTNTVYGTAVEFVAIWKPTVTYNANGGSGSMTTDTLTPDLDGNLYTYENYSVRGCTFTKSNASFTGWNTKADGTGTAYSAGQTITSLSSSDPITLYAQWSDGSSSGGGTGEGHTLTLNANGGSGTKTYTIKDGQKYTAVIGSTMPKPTKTNAVFNGWYNTEYDYWLLDSSAGVFNVGKDITFYAQWEEYETFSDPGSGSYKLTFDPNGGTMKTAKSFTINVGQTYGDAIGGYPFATRFGYTLDYWLLPEYGFGITKDNLYGNYMVAEAAGNYTFYAQWEYIHDHTCKYKDVRTTVTPTCTSAGSKLQACLCGGTKTVALSKLAHSYTVDWGTIAATCMNNAKVQKKCATCESVTTTEQTGTKLSHTYGDWVDQGNGKSIRSCIYGCGTTETKNNSYTITYLDKSGAAFSGTLNASTKFTHTYGTATTLYNPTKTGYTFGGWFISPDCSGTKLTSLTATGYSNDIVLYALWTTNTYKITYYRSDATSTAVDASWLPANYPTTHTYGTDTVLPANVNRPGWTFNGWYTKTTYTDANKVTSLSGTGYTAAIKLYGQFTVNTYNITYYDEGGKPFSGTHASGQITEFKYNTAYTLKKATKTGYTFAGWYTDPACTVSIGTALAKNTYAGDLKLYCKWTPNSYNITYYRGTSTTKMTGTTYFPDGYPATHTYDTTTVLPTNVVYGTRYFLGFYTDKNYTNRITEIGPKDITANLALYSKWETEANHVCTGDITDGSYTLTERIEPTCHSVGKESYTCYCNNSTGSQEIPYVYVELPMTEHSYIDHAGKAATCTEDGWEAYKTCASCDHTTYKVISATGHKYSVTTIPATCTENGKAVYSCENCDFSLSMPTSALGHKYEAEVVLPDCETNGYTTYTCSACGDSYVSDEVEAFGHNYTFKVTVKPTCAVLGEMLYTCSRCDGTYTEVIDYADHTYNAVITAPTCTDGGYTTYTCSVCSTCYTTDETAANGHSYGAWTEIIAPTYDETGLAERACTVCSVTETKELPVKELVTGTPVVTKVHNYTVTIEGMIGVREVKFAIGHYTTGSEVKAAEGVLTLSEDLVNKNTDENGVFRYEVAKAGGYTFWVRMRDGGEYFVYADITEINTYLTAYGVILTVNDFKDGYKDLWIAKGDYNTYNEIKYSTGFKYQAASAKLDTLFANHDLTYTCPEPGVHTVLIRYTDGSYEVHHIDLTVDVPTFYENGLQVTVSNIPDIKIIRTAYGQYNSVAEIKAAEGVRNFNNKNVIKDAESYKIQYREEGWVTLIVEYNNGYKHIHHYYVQPKAPTMVQGTNSVTFGELDGLYIIRYAPGNYTTSSDIKNAPGSDFCKSADINEKGEIVIDNLTTGRWSFMVQYDDESYNFYVIDVA